MHQQGLFSFENIVRNLNEYIASAVLATQISELKMSNCIRVLGSSVLISRFLYLLRLDRI
jgi:hypothetical protein